MRDIGFKKIRTDGVRTVRVNLTFPLAFISSIENGSWGNSSNETAYDEIIFWAYECIEIYPFQYPSSTAALTNSQAFSKAENRIFIFLGRKLFSEVYLEHPVWRIDSLPVNIRWFNWTLFRIQIFHSWLRKWPNTIISLWTSIIWCTDTRPWNIRISVQVCTKTWTEN